MRRLLLLLLLTALVGCGKMTPPRISSVEVEPQWERVATADYPDRVVVKVTLENPSAAVKILRGRARIGYLGRRVAMLTLEEKKKIPARTNAVVEIPLRLNIQRTAQTVQLQAALKQGQTEGIEIDWQVALRSRGVYVEQVQEPTPLERIAGAQMTEIREMLKDIFEE